MKIKYSFLAVIGLVLALANSAFAQSPKGAEQLAARPARTEVPQPTSAIVNPKSGVTYSVHSRTFIKNPKTGEVTGELVTFRERGLWGNGCLTQLLLDDEGHPLAVLNASSSAGPGNALIQGASFVGGMYMFGEHIRPSKTEVNGGSSSSTSNGGNSTAVGTGGNSSASSSATGGNATGGNATATGGNATGGSSTGGHGHGHPDSPGNGGIPGDGGQNGHGHGHGHGHNHE